MSRLSVDIDLCYLKIEPRDVSLKVIETELGLITQRIKDKFSNININTQYTKAEQAKNIIIEQNGVVVKIEINLVVRGALYNCTELPLCEKAREISSDRIIARCLSFADIYGGKICAALDRQHPRDWYDCFILLENEGVTEEIRKSFILYLLSSKRPIVEILDPSIIDQRLLFTNELAGMNEFIPDYQTLSAVRLKLVSVIKETMTDWERLFLISFKKGKPKWEKSGIEGLEHYPAVKWKLFNIQNMSLEKHRMAIAKLEKLLIDIA
jgi:predicted nucleotidyltransferase component of viral defense system